MDNVRKYAKEITIEERLEIEKCLSLNYRYDLIAQSLKRSAGTIKNEIIRNGGRQLYKAEFAQARAELMKRSRTKSSNGNANTSVDGSLKVIREQLSDLKGQIEIIVDFIREVKQEV